MDNIILKQYFEMFDELPPISNTLDYNDDFYEDLMLKAIKEGKPITNEELENALEKIETDTTINESGEEEMPDEKRIRELLKRYGAEDNEIENFMQDLAETKEDIKDLEDARKDEVEGAKEYQEMKEENSDNSFDDELEDIKDDEEDHEEYLFNEKNMQILKATKEGQDLIINAPKMAKDELVRAVKKLLGN